MAELIDDAQFVPVVRNDLLRRDVEMGSVVWSPARSAPVALDPVASVMLGVIDGTATVRELAADVQEVVGLSPEAATAQMDRIVQLFDRAGLLTSSADEPAGARSGIFISPVSSCMETSSCTGKVTAVNLEIAGERFRVAVGSGRVARRLRKAMADHVIGEQAPLGFMLRAPHRSQRNHVLVDRGGFPVGSTKHPDEALAMIGGHLAAAVPPRPGQVRLRVRALVRDDRAVLCVFPVLFAPPVQEDVLASTGFQVLDRLVVDLDAAGQLTVEAPPWEALAQLEPPGTHCTRTRSPVPVTDVLVAQAPGALTPPTQAELSALLAFEAVAGTRDEVLDLVTRMAQQCRVDQVDALAPAGLAAALERCRQ